MRQFTVLCACLIGAALTMGSAYAQCTSTYSDGYVDSSDTAWAWATVSDTWNQGGSCAPPGGISFTHSYSAAVGISSPGGRYSSGSDTGSAYMGGGSAYASTSMSLDDDFGTYYLDELEEIDCTAVGGLLYVSNSTPWIAFGAALTSYQYNNTQTSGGLCNYNKTCSDTFNYCGSQTTSFAKVSGVCAQYQSTFWKFYKIFGYRSCSSIRDPLTGLWSTWSNTYVACDGPLP